MKCKMNSEREVEYPCFRGCPLFFDCLMAFETELADKKPLADDVKEAAMTVEEYDLLIDQKRQNVTALQNEIHALENEKHMQYTAPEVQLLLGKCYVYKNNSYSCPEEKSDYWNMYSKIFVINDLRVRYYEFWEDSWGTIHSDTGEQFYKNFLANREEIPEQTYQQKVGALLVDFENRANAAGGEDSE